MGNAYDAGNAPRDVFDREFEAAEEIPPQDAPNGPPPDEAPARSTWWPMDLTTIADAAIEEPTILPRTDGVRLLYAGKVSSIAGEPGGGKTWFALVAVLDVLRAGGRVLYLDFEDSPQGIASRLRALGATDDEIRRCAYARPDEPIGLDFEEILTNAAPELVIVDGVTSAYELHELEPNDAKQTATFYRLLPERCARAGAAVLTIDHVVKLREQRGAWATGSGAKKALITGTLYQLEVEAPFGVGRCGRMRILVAKDRPGTVQGYAIDGKHVGTLALMSLPDRSIVWSIEPPSAAETAARRTDDPEDELEALMELVSTFIEKHDGCSGSQIEQGMKGKGAKGKITAARQTLEDNGFARRDCAKNGKRAGWHSVKPYRVAGYVEPQAEPGEDE